MAAGRTPTLLRVLRLARLVLHLLHGLAITSLLFPWLSKAKRDARKRGWSRKLLSILSVTVRERNAPDSLPGRCMLVLNHISWLDIFVINARSPATFIAKSEIRDWPFVGWLCTLVGTLYIERGRPAAARKASSAIISELQHGVLIAVFPEGTTTFGRSLESFHSAMFQPALDAGATLQPIALRYLDAAGTPTDAAGYVGETSFLESVWTIVCARHIVAELTLVAPISVSGETRRSLAEKTEAAIADALGVPAPAAHHSRRRKPGTDAGPRGG
ncbi:MAG TPA: lysophospholipid acyltransferase family protein [Burkholderiales bacterium]|jgi:1-acyl-sn-glycerol-3-phosphate acyltransferase|nr:lysophospholipid acyltransferase family protein [Burkholderiales bacterium]